MKTKYDTAVRIAHALGDCIRAEKAIRSAIDALQDLAEKAPFAIDLESAGECQVSVQKLCDIRNRIADEQSAIHGILTHHR
jgi:hypothetical protein